MPTALTLLPIPENRPIWQRLDDIERSRTGLAERTHVGADGELIWNSNDNPVPVDVFRDAYVAAPAAQAAAAKAHTDAFLAEYRANRANRVLSNEERFEARAAFGAGATVVDVITGQSWTV